MTIIDANHYLEQLLSPAELDRIARDCQFCLRKRAITPAMLVTALLRALGCDQVDGIAGLHHHFNALQLVDAHQVVVVKKNWPRSCALTRIIALIH